MSRRATGPLTAGWPQAAPYDVILVNGAVQVEPAALFGQLRDGGRLVVIAGSGPATKATLTCAPVLMSPAGRSTDANAALLPVLRRRQPSFSRPGRNAEQPAHSVQLRGIEAPDSSSHAQHIDGG